MLSNDIHNNLAIVIQSFLPSKAVNSSSLGSQTGVNTEAVQLVQHHQYNIWYPSLLQQLIWIKGVYAVKFWHFKGHEHMNISCC